MPKPTRKISPTHVPKELRSGLRPHGRRASPNARYKILQKGGALRLSLKDKENWERIIGNYLRKHPEKDREIESVFYSGIGKRQQKTKTINYATLQRWRKLLEIMKEA